MRSGWLRLAISPRCARTARPTGRCPPGAAGASTFPDVLQLILDLTLFRPPVDYRLRRPKTGEYALHRQAGQHGGQPPLLPRLRHPKERPMHLRQFVDLSPDREPRMGKPRRRRRRRRPATGPETRRRPPVKRRPAARPPPEGDPPAAGRRRGDTQTGTDSGRRRRPGGRARRPRRLPADALGGRREDLGAGGRPGAEDLREAAKEKGWTQGQFNERLGETINILAEKGLLQANFDPAAETAKLSEGGKDGKARQQEVQVFADSLKARGDIDDAEYGELMSLSPRPPA
jgi:hypothetical protein